MQDNVERNNQMVKETRLLHRDISLSDPYRPAYHFTAPYGWMNDPNGTVFWKDKWHLFYQYAPDMLHDGPALAHWGHAVSEDLVHWVDLPIALTPQPGSYDEMGCWSGTAIVDGDRVIANYHAHQGGNCLAVSSDDMLIKWEKLPGNPFIPFDPEKTYDPCIWKNDGVYNSITGRITGAKYGDGRDQEFGGNDVAYLYQSKDLDHWAYIGEFYYGGLFTNPGEDCACPDFFSIGDKFMLLFLSHNQGAQYYIGDYTDNRFIPRKHGRMNFTKPSLTHLGSSGDFAAPIAWEGSNGRRIVIAWVTEGRPFEHLKKAGWAGIMSLPRDISLDANGDLLIKPVPELKRLRFNHRNWSNITLTENDKKAFTENKMNAMEIRTVIDLHQANRIVLNICVAPNQSEYTSIIYDRICNTITLDPASSSTDKEITGIEPQIAPLLLHDKEKLDLTIYIDHSIVEVFANERQCITKRIYPQNSGSTGIELRSTGGNAFVESLDIWDMNSIW